MTDKEFSTTVHVMEGLKERLLANGVRYIAVEGNIGAGKTTLTRLISEATEARLFLEEVDDNPFIEKFYEDMQGYSFQAQIFFLLNRYRQQLTIAQQDLFNDLIVADYLFAKDSIYAHAVLGDEELILYNRLHELLEPRIIHPDLVIYLQANSEVLLHRIHRRGRSFERAITEGYLGTLNEAFNHFFFHYNESPLLIINTDRLDFAVHREHFEDLLSRVTEKFEGTRYYVPSLEIEPS